MRQIYAWRSRPLRPRAYAIGRLRAAETLGPPPGLRPELKTATQLLSPRKLAPGGRCRTVRTVLCYRPPSIGMNGYGRQRTDNRGRQTGGRDTPSSAVPPSPRSTAPLAE